ncbi:MAG: glutamate formimidoyltransferase [Bacillota bacterium]|nr:glutamate formimidoyltransferase [Bacillota bacterium]
MKKIIECVPNISEGRDQAKIDRIVAKLKDKPGFSLISAEPDKDYNRTVITVIGDPVAIADAIPDFVAEAVALIDLNHHTGEHPRMGAVDVIPFVPISGIEIEECVKIAEDVASIVSARFDIPVFLYAKAARRPERILLPDIRKGEFEGMKEKIKDPLWTPDFGPAEIHPTFGAVAIGARMPLVAFNVDLATAEEKPAKDISRYLRGSSGGYQFVQAGPAYLEQRGHYQVTMNILDHTKNPIYRIYEAVKMEAKRFKVEITGCELVGLVPAAAIVESLRYYRQPEGKKTPEDMPFEELAQEAIKRLGLRDFDAKKIIEANLPGAVK